MAQFLTQLGLKDYIRLFEQEDIDMPTLRCGFLGMRLTACS